MLADMRRSEDMSIPSGQPYTAGADASNAPAPPAQPVAADVTTMRLLDDIRRGVTNRTPTHKLEPPRPFKGTYDEEWDLKKQQFLQYKVSTNMPNDQFLLWLDNKIEGNAAKVLLGSKKK